MRALLIEHGEVYAPEPRGRTSVLVLGDTTVRIGEVDRRHLDALGLECRVLDARGGAVVPGFVDVHEHFLGAGGEQGFGSRERALEAGEVVAAGITTAVGCLGTDSVTRTLPALLGKAQEIAQQGGIATFIYTGGFHLPPASILSSVREDLVLLEKVIGSGEVAIADHRDSAPSFQALAALVSETFVGGTLSGKAGVTHFHVGPGAARLSLLHRLLDEDVVPARQLYPTHINRSEALLDDAISLARRGAWVDTDTVDRDTARWIQRYRERGGPPDRLTVSSDAQTRGATPRRLFDTFRELVMQCGLSLDAALPFFTCNPAAALRLEGRGRLVEGGMADLLILDPGTLDPVQVVAGGVPRL